MKNEKNKNERIEMTKRLEEIIKMAKEAENRESAKDALYKRCVLVMQEEYPKYLGSEELNAFFERCFKVDKEICALMERARISAILHKDAAKISKYEYAVLAKELDRIKKECETMGRDRSPEEEEFVKQVNSKLYKKMEKYIYDFVHKTYSIGYDTICGFDDLCSVCIITMIEHFPEYHETTLDLPVFFARWFKGECNTEIGKCVGRSRYYNNRLNVISRAIKKLEASGIPSEQITVTDIYKQLISDGVRDISIEKINNALLYDKKQVSYIPELGLETGNTDSELSMSPEDLFFEKENRNQINSILSVLEPTERVAYLLNSGYYTEETGFVPEKFLTAKQIAMYPNYLIELSKFSNSKKVIKEGTSADYDSLDDDLKPYFTDKYYVPVHYVKDMLARAKKKIKMHPLVLEKYDKVSDTYGVFATEEDILKETLTLEDILARL